MVSLTRGMTLQRRRKNVASKETRSQVSPDSDNGFSRRDVLTAVGALAAIGLDAMLLAACTPGGSARPSQQGRGQTAAPHGVVRLLSVPTVRDGGEWGELLPVFSHQTGIEVKLQIAENDLYDRARRGEADLVYSHYGHRDVSAFVLGGYGHWPRTILFNLIALLGPPTDPAGVRGLSDMTEAFKRIAASGSTFEVNGIPELVYLSKIILEVSGVDSGAWYVDDGLRQAPAVERASARGAYTLWGVTPFLMLAGQKRLQLAPLVTADPILQRIMVSIVVNPDKVRGVNAGAAQALQDYLLSPAAQAQIRAFRHPQLGIPIFFPAGRDNEVAAIPVT
jgi:tungstate transport system substrate-binding protein